METIPPFAPLAARLAAQAAALRPADEARDDLAKFAALVMCALLDMLVCLCTALDARASIGVWSTAAPVPRFSRAVVPVSRAGQNPVGREAGVFAEPRARGPRRDPEAGRCPSPSNACRALVALVALPRTALAVPAARWPPRLETRLFRPGLSTRILLR